MDSAAQYYNDFAALEWQVALGVDEAILNAPLNRYDFAQAEPKAKPQQAKKAAGKPAPFVAVEVDAVAVATAAAAGAADLEALKAAMAEFDLCELKLGARNLVFCDGSPEARVMIIGDAPDREEDRAGRPFVGRAGQLLDRMLGAIDLGREVPDPANQVYLTNILPWRPPSDREPTKAEMAMMLPFMKRHVELVAPDFLILMGNVSCRAIFGGKGVTRMRGTWAEVFGIAALPFLHPAHLLRTPNAKREAWADLLTLQARLAEK